MSLDQLFCKFKSTPQTPSCIGGHTSMYRAELEMGEADASKAHVENLRILEFSRLSWEYISARITTYFSK